MTPSMKFRSRLFSVAFSSTVLLSAIGIAHAGEGRTSTPDGPYILHHYDAFEVHNDWRTPLPSRLSRARLQSLADELRAKLPQSPLMVERFDVSSSFNDGRVSPLAERRRARALERAGGEPRPAMTHRMADDEWSGFNDGRRPFLSRQKRERGARIAEGVR